jgi:putative sterol carrier protein
MAIPFPTDEWVKAMAEAVNSSPTYAEAAKNWEGDFYFVVEPAGKQTETVMLYMDLWHGKCRDAFAVDGHQKTPVFRISAPATAWKKVMTKQLDPLQAMMTGQLRLQGNMSIIMRNVRAAKELVECCTRVPTEFPV